MNHIQNIEINNFKSIRNVTIADCKRINLFIGPPNVGKSNILEGLSLFGFVEGNSRSQNLNDYVRFETASSLFFEKNVSEKFSLKLNNNDTGIEGYVKQTGTNKEFHLMHFNYFNNDSLTPYSYRKTFNLTNDLNVMHYVKDSHGELGADARGFSGMDIKTPIDSLKNSNIKKYHFEKNTKYIDYNTNELNIPKGENLGTFLAYQKNKDLIKAIQQLVEPNTFELESSGGIKLRKKNNGGLNISFAYNEIADTLQRVIFHLTAVMSNENSVLLFEEPEAHCYEPYILDFTNAVKYDKQNNQYFMVTHSDYIVSEFLRDEEYRNQTNIYLVGLAQDGDTIVKLLDRQKADDVYKYGTNVFFNYEQLWNEN